LPVTNTLAYLVSSSATKEKSFITLTPGGRVFLEKGLEPRAVVQHREELEKIRVLIEVI
jgi:hypothetical protein